MENDIVLDPVTRSPALVQEESFEQPPADVTKIIPQIKNIDLVPKGLDIPKRKPAERLKNKIIKKLQSKSKRDILLGEIGRRSEQDGGFIFTLAAIIAGISAAASAAAATTIVGSVTVGTLAGAALTGAVSTAAGLIVKKIAGEGSPELVKAKLKDIALKSKITIKDFSTKDKKILKKGFEDLKKNPTKKGIIALGVKLAPSAKELVKKKIVQTAKKEGIKIPKSGSGDPKAFNKSFVKHFTKVLTK